MSEFVNTIALLGDDAVIDSIIERTITEFKDNIVTSVGNCAFRNCKQLLVVDLPNITQVGINAFAGCTSLIEINAPLVTEVWNYCFANCTSLTKVNMPLLNRGFGDSNTLAAQAFQKCTSLKTLNCHALTEPPVRFVDGCTSLEELWTPGITSGSNQYVCNDCKSLKLWDAGRITNLTAYGVLRNTPSLETLILRSEALVPITMWEGSTLHTSYTGDVVCTVYVPQDLVEAYKTATNWVALYEAGRCNFVALEGSEYE